jgi:phosphatidylserine decarboxylase
MGGLSFSDRARRSMWRIVPKRAVSDAIGWGVSLGIPTALRTVMLSRFANIYGIDVSEAEKPLTEYEGFDEFFTRKLRPGARPIDDAAGRVVSPADGTVVECGLAAAGKLIQAKGSDFDLATLLDDAEAAARLQGGAYLITYLSPKDYHRVHSPSADGWSAGGTCQGRCSPSGRRASGVSRACSCGTNASSRSSRWTAADWSPSSWWRPSGSGT